MKKLLVLSLVLFSFIGSNAQYKYEFTTVKDNPTTSVKNQGQTGTCWAFATISFLESEAIRKGKADTSLNLSEMYIVRDVYLNRLADNYFRRGRGNTGPGSVSHVAIKSMGRVGLVTEEAYNGLNYGTKIHNHKALQAELDSVSVKAVKERSGVPYSEYDNILNKYLGTLPSSFTYRNKNYYSLDFMKALDLDMNEYVEITSFSHQPFYQKVPLEIPDNYDHELYYNVPLDDLVSIMENAIHKGFTIAWDADVSETYFAHNNHIALFTPGENLKRVKDASFPSRYQESPINQEIRQKMFEDFTTTDDHLMHIVGMATDQNGVKYFKVKNSWGPESNGDGYLYVSESYIRAKTIAIMVHINAIPRNIRKSLSLSQVLKFD